MQSYISLIRRKPDFTRLWLSSAVSQIGDWFHVVVLLVLVSVLTDGSGLAVSGLMLAQIAPYVVVMPYAGILADRLDRRHLLIWMDILRAVVMVALMVAVWQQSLWMIYSLIVVRACFSAVSEPTKLAIVPLVVERSDLVLANTLLSISWSVMITVGAVIGGAVAMWFGDYVALTLDALTFLISAWLVAGVVIPKTKTSRAVTPLRDFRQGVRYVVDHPHTGIVLFVKGFGSIGNMDTIMTIFVTQVFLFTDNSTQMLGWTYAATGVGAVAGPLLFNRFNDGSPKALRLWIGIGLVFKVAAWVLMIQAPGFWWVCGAVVIHAIGGSANWTYSSVLLQHDTPDEVMGRVISLERLILQAISTASVIGTGWLIDRVGVGLLDQALWVIAGISVVALLVWASGVRWLDRPPRPGVKARASA